MSIICNSIWECSGSVVECLTQDQGAAGLSLTGVAALCHINPSLVMVKHRKTRPYITERLLMGRKESNQTNKKSNSISCDILSEIRRLYVNLLVIGWQVYL